MKKQRFLGAVLLISGTTIGAGMLAMPLSTGQAGFFLSFLFLFAIFLFMMLTAFYFLEVNLAVDKAFDKKSNLISMVRLTLGKGGEIVAWVTYLLLLYSLTSAYVVGCSQILADFFGHWIKNFALFPILVFLFFAIFLYLGTPLMDLINRALMIGLFGSYAGLLILGAPSLDLTLLSHVNFHCVVGALSVVITSFGYHIIIPTLVDYLDRDVRLLKKAIVIGSFIPFVIYVLWQLMITGIIPVEGECGLKRGAELGLQATIFLKNVIDNPLIIFIARTFGFFAIVTSLLGVTLSLSDFLADGLRIKKSLSGKSLLCCLTFIPPLIFALYYPQGFIVALKYAGIFVLILLAILPLLMAYRVRYSKIKGIVEKPFRVFGGKALIITTLVVALFLFYVEAWSLL